MDAWNEQIAGVVTFPDGTRVRGRGLHEGTPGGELTPQFGLYLTGKPHMEPDWECRWVRWPDFRLPHSTAEAVGALAEVFRRAASSKVEIACAGGTGRTGSALAILARLSGVPSGDAIAWVRANYRPRAVETFRQRRWVQRTPI
ncbi:protein-tyrosine phosphatase family protein [Humibacter antri]